MGIALGWRHTKSWQNSESRWERITCRKYKFNGSQISHPNLNSDATGKADRGRGQPRQKEGAQRPGPAENHLCVNIHTRILKVGFERPSYCTVYCDQTPCPNLKAFKNKEQTSPPPKTSSQTAQTGLCWKRETNEVCEPNTRHKTQTPTSPMGSQQRIQLQQRLPGLIWRQYLQRSPEALQRQLQCRPDSSPWHSLPDGPTKSNQTSLSFATKS